MLWCECELIAYVTKWSDLELISALLSVIGLAFPSGLNAWIPILILALADRFSSQVELEHPYSLISSPVGIVVILLLLPVELIADKIPGADHVNDVIHTFIRPVVGGLIAVAVANSSSELNVILAALLGAGGAGGTHALKMSSRPVITVSTGGIGNPIASILEDTAAIVSSIVALFVPLLILAILPIVGGALLLAWRRLRKGSKRLQRISARSP